MRGVDAATDPAEVVELISSRDRSDEMLIGKGRSFGRSTKREHPQVAVAMPASRAHPDPAPGVGLGLDLGLKASQLVRAHPGLPRCITPSTQFPTRPPSTLSG